MLACVDFLSRSVLDPLTPRTERQKACSIFDDWNVVPMMFNLVHNVCEFQKGFVSPG
jgi:hypothetical protein